MLGFERPEFLVEHSSKRMSTSLNTLDLKISIEQVLGFSGGDGRPLVLQGQIPLLSCM
jgi:hypothetical protein